MDTTPHHRIALRRADGLPCGEAIELTCHEPEAGDTDEVVLEAAWRGQCQRFAARDWFAALAALREVLAREGLLPDCYGAAIDVFPSPMARSMGYGDKAYRHRPGVPATTADLVPVFGSAAGLVLASVAEQAEFHLRWLDSLH